LGFDEEVLEAAEVEGYPGDRSADALKRKKPGAGVDIGVGLALEGEAERYKHQRDREPPKSVIR
jgi:hypothetical protein